jgi:hypothetical protein
MARRFILSLRGSTLQLLRAAALTAGVAAGPAFAQEQDAQLWIRVGASAPLTKAVSLRLETNQRFSDDRGGLYESQYLAAIALAAADDVTLTGGVNRIVARSDGRIAATEWRPRQQVSFPIAGIGRGELAGRVRLEQRFRSDDSEVGHRVRPELSYGLPIGGSLELALAHESFLNFNSTSFQRSGYERMRNSAALALPVSPTLVVRAGYLIQYRFNGEARDLMEHALTLGLAASF